MSTLVILPESVAYGFRSAAGGPQVGQYGGGYHITAQSQFTSDQNAGTGFFSGGYRMPGGATLGTGSGSIMETTLLNQQIDAQRKAQGFATGGSIAPGDTQKVEFYKNQNERVIIARPDQYEDRRGRNEKPASNDNSKHVSVTVNMAPGADPISRQSALAAADVIARQVQAAMARV